MAERGPTKTGKFYFYVPSMKLNQVSDKRAKKALLLIIYCDNF